MRPTHRVLLLLLPPVLLLAAFYISAGRVALESFVEGDRLTLVHYINFLSGPYLGILVYTIWIATLTTVFCIGLGYPTAYVIARTPRWRNVLLLIVVMPWLVSIVVRTYGWVVLLGNQGLINASFQALGLTSGPVQLMFNSTGVVIGLVHVFCPFMVICVLSALLRLDGSLEEAAMSLGARRSETFFRVVLPLSLPGVTSGAVLVFLMSMGAIVTPLLLGGLGQKMLGTQVYQEVFQLFNFPKAASLAVVLTAAALVLIAPVRWIERRVTRNLRSANE